MVTIAKAGSFLRSQVVDPTVLRHVDQFFNAFRKKECVLHPYDPGDRSYYFSDQVTIDNLFFVRYSLESTGPVQEAFPFCFDGRPFDLADVSALLNEYFQYLADNFNPKPTLERPVNTLVMGPSTWCGFMIYTDREGPTSTALYSRHLKPHEGVTLLHIAMRQRFLMHE